MVRQSVALKQPSRGSCGAESSKCRPWHALTAAAPAAAGAGAAPRPGAPTCCRLARRCGSGRCNCRAGEGREYISFCAQRSLWHHQAWHAAACLGPPPGVQQLVCQRAVGLPQELLVLRAGGVVVVWNKKTVRGMLMA